MSKNIKPLYWQEAKAHLSSKDKEMKRIIKNNSDSFLTKSDDSFKTLTKSIIGQQISTVVANNIWQKLQNELVIKSDTFASMRIDSLKKFGLSKQKSNYLINIANHFQKFSCNKKNYWDKKNYQEIYKELINIKGIGPWTIEMFAIFYLNNPDIIPLADIGLQKAVQKIYNAGEKLSKEQIIKISEKWYPYRTVATWFLWRTIDNNIVSY